MKTLFTLLIGFAVLFAGMDILKGQSNFYPEVYKAYLETNKNISATQILEKYPPQTTYYSSRSNPSDLNKIPWFDSINRVYSLTGQERDLLSQNFFMVSERLKSYSWSDAMIQVYNNDLPLFISSDFVLFTLHNSYDNILLTLEWQLLEPNLMELLDAMYSGYPALFTKYSGDDRYADALGDVDLFISVARSLLYDMNYLPQSHTAEKFNEIMQLIVQEQMTSTTLFTETRTRKIDFSQFTPRGHYTKKFWTGEGERTLENYFRAMMWLGRIDFLLTAPPSNPWELDWTDDELRRMQLGALLVNELLYTCGKKENLDLHEKIITYMVGPDDNMTTAELHGLSERLLTSPADLFNENTFSVFKDSLNSSDDYGQKIMSNFFYVDPYSEDPGQLPVSYKLLGQKFLIDSYVFSEVVYDRIIVNGVKIWRGLPDPLDAMAVLGNEDAIALLEAELEAYQYAYKVDALRYLVDAYDEDFWQQSLYNTWLGAIRELNPPASSAQLPYFMQTTAWHQEKLNTQLCSWAELRHDNLLYGKQSYTGGTACSYPYSYVEPYPDFYGQLGTFAENAAVFFQDVLKEKQFSSGESMIMYYQGYAGIMKKFEEISKKELAGAAISEEEITFLKTMINSFMASGPSVTGWILDLFFSVEAGLNMDFVVADVHTQPTDRAGAVVGHVLHVGNGLINNGVFLAPNPANPEQLMAFTGPVSSFHYEVTSNFKRLTDEEWKEKFMIGTLPTRPDWIENYMAGPTGGVLPEGRKLKGQEYTGTYTDPADLVNSLDYLLAFPNPARGELHLRFVLNRKSYIRAEIYDASGRMVKQFYNGILMPAEHDLSLDVSAWNAGLYIIKFRAGENNMFRKVFVF
ncbi:DUF3160 domain-containing protein [Bacteroidota bacterium]